MCPAVRTAELPEKVFPSNPCLEIAWLVSLLLKICNHDMLCLRLLIISVQPLALPQVGVLVVGAGPTGLGAATRLHQHGLQDWLLIDKVYSVINADRILTWPSRLRSRMILVDKMD